MVYTILVIVGSGDQNAYPSSTVSDFTVELADALLLQRSTQVGGSAGVTAVLSQPQLQVRHSPSLCSSCSVVLRLFVEKR